ncbi:MAG: DUF4185 domain-containing protein [Aldersonia sp.]|nr:DUF4185 domain-containing protein [Aldersonia sp.]
MSVVAVAVLAAGAVLVASNPGADAAPGAVSGAGPCSTDPSPTHEPLVGKTQEVIVPYPAVTAVPFPAPTTTPARTTQALPPNPCENPCPDLTDRPTGSSLSSDLGIPQLVLNFQPFYFGIPVPGPEQDLSAPPEPAQPVIERASPEPAPPMPRIGKVTEVAKQTGANSINRTDKRWQVHGTDLGIMWESKPGEIASVFGDTVGVGFHPPGGFGEDWRSNVLAFSTDADLSDGMTYDGMVQDSRCHAAELLSSRKLDNVEITTIPTSGFAIGDRQYLSYVSIRSWNSVPGLMFTNYGGIAYSDDHGQTWTKDPYAKWDNIFGIAKFQVTTMVPHGDFVYMFGTPNSRLGDVGLARVPVEQVLNTSAYQYWQNGNWTPVGGAAAATPIVQGPAGELSVRYDDERGLWQMSYLDTGKAAITLREARTPQGAWSDGAPTTTVADYPFLYGGFIHPWSKGNELYYNISTWSDYNVYLMRAELE